MVGAELGIFGYFSPEFKYMLTVAPFLNLYDTYKSFVPFMLWRGSLGIKNYLEFSGLAWSKDNRFIIKLGLVHESDHFTGGVDSDSSTEYWIDYDLYFSHMNYLDLGFISVNNLSGKDSVLVFNAGYKYNLNNSFDIAGYLRADRTPVHYIYGEGSLTLKANDTTDIYFSAYLEKIFNTPDFLKDYSLHPGILSATGSDYLYLNLGVKFKGSSGINYQPFLIYSYSNGRGVDYLMREDVYGLGIRIVI